MEDVAMRLQDLIAFYGLKIIAALAILVIGRYVAIAARNVLRRVMRKSNVEETLVSFVFLKFLRLNYRNLYPGQGLTQRFQK